MRCFCICMYSYNLKYTFLKYYFINRGRKQVYLNLFREERAGFASNNADCLRIKDTLL